VAPTTQAPEQIPCNLLFAVDSGRLENPLYETHVTWERARTAKEEIAA
jgi:hypothetical protein